MRLECKCCGGVYDDVQPDGLRYFHVCPPLTRAELDQAVSDGRVALPKGETVDQALERRVYLRGGARNENAVQSTDAAIRGAIVAEGKGVRELGRTAPRNAPVVVPD